MKKLLKKREIKRRPGVFWKNNIGVSQQVKAMEVKAVIHFMHRSKASEINNYQKRLVSPKTNHCDIRRYHKFWWVVNSTDKLEPSEILKRQIYYRKSRFLPLSLTLDKHHNVALLLI